MIDRNAANGGANGDANGDAPKPRRVEPGGDGDNGDGNWIVLTRFKPLLFAARTGLANELVVVESPWLRVVNQLPDPIYRPRYGPDRGS